MSEQTVETKIETEFQPDSTGNLVPQSEEEKFFGVKTEIPSKEEAEEISVEVVDEIVDEPIEEEKEEVDEATLDEVLNQQATNNAQWAKLNAQAKFKEAYENGDSDAMSAAQEELTRATLAEQAASQYSATLQNQLNHQLQQEQINNPVPQGQPQLDPDMQAWSAQNPWFMSTVPEHQEMTSYAMTIDQRLRNKGIKPEVDSKLYYEEVDKAMRNEYPSFFGVTTTEVDSEPVGEKRQPQNVVAPASRTSGSKNSRSIRLTQAQVKLARQLGISPEQYAKQLLQES